MKVVLFIAFVRKIKQYRKTCST